MLAANRPSLDPNLAPNLASTFALGFPAVNAPSKSETAGRALEVQSPPSTDGLPMLVELPPELSNFFIESGYLETVYGEQRCQNRLRVRCVATMESDFVPPFTSRARRQARVLIKDMSRSGLGLLVHEQLYPEETFFVELHDRRLHVRVVRCRKLGPLCYEVGGVVIGIE